tara:strand:+ start:4327 stop:6939 length:2613 start_codon:yes stop_codon:yes gene_type:complete
MTTYYVDFENGTQNAAGTSFATRKDRILPSWALNPGDEIRIMGSPDPTLLGTGSVTANWQPNNYGGGQTNMNITFSTTTGATNINLSGIGTRFSTGDTIFIYEFNPGNANENINGTWTVTRVDADNIKLDGYTAATAVTSSSIYTKYFIRSNCTIMLDSAVTKNIASFGPRTSSWTASTNVTTSLVTNNSWIWGSSNQYFNEHYYSDRIQIADAFGTGKAAYWATGALDLSGYQQLSFKLLGGATQYYGSNCSLRLCSDSSGNTTVNTLNFDLTGNNKDAWAEVVVDLGSNFGNNINSIALYVDTDQGAQDFIISNIIACKSSSSADSLTHRSIIGLNTTADPCWYGIESINGKRIILESKFKPNSSAIGYYGNWQNAGFSANLSSTNIYKRETNRLKTIIETNGTSSTGSTQSSWNVTSTDNTSTNRITVSGGWDRTNMSTQSLDSSFLDGITKKSNGFFLNGFANCNVSKIGFVRATVLIQSNNYVAFEDIDVAHQCGERGLYLAYCKTRKLKNITCGMNQLYITGNYFLKDSSTQGNEVNSDESSKADYELYATGGNYFAVFYIANTYTETYIGKLTAKGGELGLRLDSSSYKITFDEVDVSAAAYGIITFYNNDEIIINNLTLKNINTTGFRNGQSNVTTIDNFVYTQDTTIYSAYNSGPASELVQVNDGTLILTGPQIEGKQVSVGDSAAVLKTSDDQITGTYSSTPIGQNLGLWARRNANNVNGVYENHYAKGLVKNDTSTRHTNSGFAWSFYNNGTGGRATSVNDLKNHFGKFAVASGSQVTVKIWVLASNSDVKAQLIIEKNELIGMTADVVTETTSYSSSWQELTAQVTPTAAGFINVYVTTYGANQNDTNYFDDMSITQA